MRSPRPTALVALGLTAALTGCTTPSAQPAAPAGSTTPTPSISAVAVDARLAAAVPAAVREAGTVRVATDPTYPPFENVVDGQVVGLDADLGHAIGDVLDLDVEFVTTSFDAIIPALQAGTVDMALSSMGDSKTREETVDFATYYWNGTLLLTGPGNPTGSTPELACGAKVGVIRGSLQQQQYLPAQAAPCAARGEAAPVESAFQNSNQAVLALQAGRVDAVLADAPVVSQAVAAGGDALEAVGPLQRNPNPGGAAFPRGSGLTQPVSDAVDVLVQNGTYAQILAKWGLQDIAVQDSVVNGAVE